MICTEIPIVCFRSSCSPQICQRRGTQRKNSGWRHFFKLSVNKGQDPLIPDTYEPARWAFKMYDKDGSGSIEIEEMVEIVGNMFELEGLSKVLMFKTGHSTIFNIK